MPAEGEAKKGTSWFVFFLRLLKLLAVICLLADIIAYILVIKTGFDSNLGGLEKTFLLFANAGYIIFSIVLILAEFEVQAFIRIAYILHYWFGRGFCLLWLGVNTISGAKQIATAVGNAGVSDVGLVEGFGQGIGWTMIGVGLIYMLMSLMCIRAIAGGSEDELQVHLISRGDAEAGGATPVTVSGGGGSSAADALLIANMAVALGIPASDCKKRFAGKAGAKEAEKLVKDRAAAAAKNAAAASSSAKNSARDRGESMSGGGGGGYNPPSVSPPPPTTSNHTSTHLNDHDDDFGKKKGAADDDEDELARMYYASRVKQ